MIARRWLLLAGFVSALLFGGCSSFEREWKRAPRSAAGQGDPWGGAWDGQWTSEKHRLPSGPSGGRLRCLFTRVDEAHYRARFHANWLCFATGYEVTFETQRRGDLLAFRGAQDLGAIFGGVYRYEGRVTRERFHANFASRFDYGRFELRRPPAE